MTGERDRLRRVETWIAWVRAAAVPFALFQVSVTTYAPGFRTWAWVVTGVFVAGTAVLFPLARRRWTPDGQRLLSYGALAFDVGVVCGYALAFSFQVETPTRQVFFLVVVEAAVRHGLRGSLLTALATVPALVGFEELRSSHTLPHGYRWSYVTFQTGVEILFALIVGWLVYRLGLERALAESRAREAETLRDELGRRADLLDAANRCARALSSSLDLDEAFGAFIRELSGLVEFDRVAIVVLDGGEAHTLASAGRGEGEVYPAGTRSPAAGSLLPEIVAGGRTIVRHDMQPPRHPEEDEFLRLGLRTRVAAPVSAGVRPLGMLSLVRAEPGSFAPDEVELVTLLGRLVGSAVQNIRAFESERTTVDELRRLSALRADFVSLVSHELRSPMAAVIGSAQTLRQRWRELSPEQRQAFLALIADETNRLAALVGDVLDTSRIEAGSFTYSFRDVDLAALLRDSVAAAVLAQDEVPVELRVEEPLPAVRGDGERLRQIVVNLIDNAVKYSPGGVPVEVRARADDGRVSIAVRDRGPGIPHEHQQAIFEKFGRVESAAGKPGTGLGLFIARSIADAHGGSLEVESAPGAGATFTLRLPA